MKLVKTQASTLLLAAISALTASPAAYALKFTIADTEISVENLLTAGALMRMQGSDSTLISKSNINPGICVRRTSPDPYDADNRTYAGNTCNPGEMTGAENANDFYIRQPGAFSPNGDNGNLNFEKYDIVSANTKLTSDISFEIADFKFFTRTTGYFDAKYSHLNEQHPDTTAQLSDTNYPSLSRELSGVRAKFLDYFVSRKFEIADRNFNLKVGNQVLNWGESSFLLANSLNAINPADQAILRIPGFDVKELLQPQGMALLDGDVVDGVSFQAFYQYKWKPIIVDPVGSYFSTSDIVGPGGDYAMLSFGKAPEDPLQLYEPRRNPDDPAYILNSTSSRTLLVDHSEGQKRRPSDGGQYGMAVKMFLEGLNNGTELAFYFANYHARVPSVSGLAANATCIPAGTDNLANPAQLAATAQACGLDLATVPTALAQPNPQLALANEALPLDSARLFIEYPENIQMYGMSFNTTLGDFAVSGEYVFRPNLPVQIHSTDLVFALLQPAFPDRDVAVVPGTTLPGRRTAVPDFLTGYRGQTPGGVQPGQYIRGYESQKIGQAGLTFLKTIGGDNFLGATQMTLLLELGYTHLPGMPGLDELQFNGAGTDTHISSGADGSTGINPRDIRTNPNDPSSSQSSATPTLRQNPIAWYDLGGFGTKESYGYRFVTLTRFDDAFLGANVELLNALFHDVEGVGPGLGQNFVEGRKTILSGIRMDYLSRFIGELRYTWYTGGGIRDALRDRDNLFLFLGYQF